MSAADTNFAAATDARPESGPVIGATRRMPALSTLLVLIKREFWEHRVLWMAPVLIAVCLVACAFPAHVHFDRLDPPAHIQFNALDTDAINAGQAKLAWFALIQWGLTVPQYLVMLIVLNFYLLDCLYAERKDRSILFWKSLPASDGATVASKLLVALIVVPFGVYLLSVVTNLLFTGVWFARTSMGYLPATLAVWDTMTWLKVEALMLIGLIVSILWYAPLAAYLLLVSAWARRSVMLWAILPPVFAVAIERVAFGTHYLSGLINYRTFGIWHSIHLDRAIEQTVVSDGQEKIVSLSGIFDAIHLGDVLRNSDLWLGLIAAGVFAYAATRLRRYRDDT